jgi:hypothetical protein
VTLRATVGVSASPWQWACSQLHGGIVIECGSLGWADWYTFSLSTA